MRFERSQVALGAALLGAFAAFRRWHSPPASKLTKEEIDRYLEAISRIPLPAGEAGQARRPASSPAS